jgi:hypothetical protein
MINERARATTHAIHGTGTCSIGSGCAIQGPNPVQIPPMRRLSGGRCADLQRVILAKSLALGLGAGAGG